MNGLQGQQTQNFFGLQNMIGAQIPQQFINPYPQQIPNQQQQQLQQNNVNNQNNNEENISPTKRKNNRDPRNRIWICGCGRSYGSNAALYTHIKNKHNGFQPKNTIKPPQSEQAGKRGRPLQNIKKYGQFKKGVDFVEIDNIEERRNKIIHDKDSNHLLVAFLEFGDSETSKNPFEGIVTDKKGQEFLQSGLQADHIIKVEKEFRKQFNIEKDKILNDNTYQILQRFAQVWSLDQHAEEFLRIIIFSQFYEGQKSQQILDHLQQFKKTDKSQNNENTQETEESQQKLQNNNDKQNQFPYLLYCSEQLDQFDQRLDELIKKIYEILNPSEEESDTNMSDISEERPSLQNTHKMSYNKQSDEDKQFSQYQDSVQESKGLISLKKVKQNSSQQQINEEIDSQEQDEEDQEKHDEQENHQNDQELNDSIQQFLTQYKQKKKEKEQQKLLDQQKDVQQPLQNQNNIQNQTFQQNSVEQETIQNKNNITNNNCQNNNNIDQNSEKLQNTNEINNHNSNIQEQNIQKKLSVSENQEKEEQIENEQNNQENLKQSEKKEQINQNNDNQNEKIVQQININNDNNDNDLEQSTAPVTDMKKKKSQQYGSEDDSTSQQNQLITGNINQGTSASSHNNSSNKNSCKNSTDITQVLPSQKVE